MKTVHITLQGKGGVGKSFVSSLVAQHLKSRGLPVICVDTDPINATLSGYESLEVLRLELIREGQIDPRGFDPLIEKILEEDSHFVVDNGASGFVALSNYLVENRVIQTISAAGKQVVIHTIVTGGQAMRDTLNGFLALAEQLPDEARLVVWLNEFFGEINTHSNTGEKLSFEDLEAYTNVRERVYAIVRLHKQSAETFGKDIELMLDAKLTFDDVMASEEFRLMSKLRLKEIQRSVFDQLATAI